MTRTDSQLQFEIGFTEHGMKEREREGKRRWNIFIFLKKGQILLHTHKASVALRKQRSRSQKPAFHHSVDKSMLKRY